MSNKQSSDQKTTQFGQYVTQEIINENNIYTLYSGQSSFEEIVFIEQLNTTEPEQVQLFQQRIEQIQAFNNDSIAPILDSETDAKQKPYIVYSAGKGKLLSTVIAQDFQGLQENIVLKIGQQLGEALQQLESAKLAHLDLRPENIILNSDNTISLIGVATPHNAPLENRPFSKKYLDFASPEQIGNQSPTIASNMFSIGVVLYTLLVGHSPEYQVTNWDIFSQGDDITFETLDNVSKSLNPYTYQLIRKCLGRKTWGRFENSTELLNTVKKAIHSIETKSEDNKKSPLPVNLPKDNRILYGSLALITALIVIGVLALFRSIQNRTFTSNIEETPSGLTIIEDTSEPPTKTPFPSTNTPIPLEATLLQPPEGAELNSLDQLTFAWSWPQTLLEDEQFVLIVKSGNQIVYQTQEQQPSGNSRFQHATQIDEFASRSGDYSWQVILQAQDGSTKYSSPNGAFSVIVSTPTPTPTELPTESPTLTPTVTNTPEPTPTPTPEECAPARPNGWVSYAFKSGDNLFNLAIQTGTTVERIEEVSCISASSIRAGEEIFLPSLPATETPLPTATPTPSNSGGGDSGGGGDGGGGNPTNPTATPPSLP